MLAQFVQVLAIGVEHLAVELQKHMAGHPQLAGVADVEQPVQVSEAILRCVDRFGRFRFVLGPPFGLRQVGQVRDDEIDRNGNGFEQVAEHYVHSVGDTVSLGVRARELDRGLASVDRPHFDLRRRDRDRDSDHTRTGTDVGNAQFPAADFLQRRVDERFRCGSGGEDAAGRGEKVESVKSDFHENGAVTDWAQHLQREQERYRDGEARLPEAEDEDVRQRQLTRLGNAAAAAGLALMMQGRREEAHSWFDRACARYRESWEHAPPGSWGRPVAILKARILAGDWSGAARDAGWTQEAGAGEAESPIGRYAAALAGAVLGEWVAVRMLADGLRTHDGFPTDVGDALAYIAADDPVGYTGAIESVLESFETREAYLEDLPAADTVLVLQALAERRGLAPAELESELLPARL